MKNKQMKNKKTKKQKTKNKKTKISIKKEKKEKILSEINKIKSQLAEKEKNKEKHKEKNKLGILESYQIDVDGAKVKVEIKRESATTTYNLIIPEIGLATSTLLNEIRNELVTATTISMKEIADPTAFNSIKKRFMKEAESLLQTNLPSLSSKMKDFLIGKLIQDMLGLGEIEFLVNDPH